MSDDASLTDEEMGARQPTASLESPVITTAVRSVLPFVFAYGAFLTLHGTKLPGGGFQGGVVLGSVIILMGLGFGIEPTARWLPGRLVTGLFVLGIAGFVTVGALAHPYGGRVFEIAVLPGPTIWTAELLEVTIGLVVATAIAGLFVALGSDTQDGGEGGD